MRAKRSERVDGNNQRKREMREMQKNAICGMFFCSFLEGEPKAFHSECNLASSLDFNEL